MIKNTYFVFSIESVTLCLVQEFVTETLTRGWQSLESAVALCDDTNTDCGYIKGTGKGEGNVKYNVCIIVLAVRLAAKSIQPPSVTSSLYNVSALPLWR